MGTIMEAHNSVCSAGKSYSIAPMPLCAFTWG